MEERNLENTIINQSDSRSEVDLNQTESPTKNHYQVIINECSALNSEAASVNLKRPAQQREVTRFYNGC